MCLAVFASGFRQGELFFRALPPEVVFYDIYDKVTFCFTESDG